MIRKPKGPTARARAQKRARQLKKERAIKEIVRADDGPWCRCCLIRQSESVHEIVPKGIGGNPNAVSLENSVHVCGDGVRGCHGFLQRHEIVVGPYGKAWTINAREGLAFTARTAAAAEWLGVVVGGGISSRPKGEVLESR